MQKACATFIALFLLVFVAAAQKAAFEFYIPDGWVGGDGIGMAQDDKGLLWFLNSDKLYRFDGRNFLVYPPPSGRFTR